MKFSVIIPAYNEAEYLPRLLDSIEVAKYNYSGGTEAVEVIVADNCSTDRTAEVAAARGAQWRRPRGRWRDCVFHRRRLSAASADLQCDRSGDENRSLCLGRHGLCIGTKI